MAGVDGATHPSAPLLPVRTPWLGASKMRKYATHVIVITLVSLTFVFHSIDRSRPLASLSKRVAFGGDLRQRCEEHFILQPLDHFDASSDLFSQRYFVCDEFAALDANPPIFFYTGNEGNVELYLNHTGLMWESAPTFGARLVFAEHRYFGQSLPPQRANQSRHEYAAHCSSQQALADNAVLLNHLRANTLTRVIAFGGSYGGMLAAWMRLKYPHLVQGAIASSAPMLSFLGFNPPMDMESFSRVVTYDASPAAGSAPRCAPNIKRVWPLVFGLGDSHEGRTKLASVFQLCQPLQSPDDVAALTDWLKDAYDTLAMGNYPYPSSYMTNGERLLPAFPMREACSLLADNLEDTTKLLQAMLASVNVYYNSTGAVKCHSIASNGDDDEDDFWDYLNCADMYTPLDATGGDNDMFWRALHNQTEDERQCQEKWGVKMRPFWPSIVYGGVEAFATSSNIVFTNGEYDPWAPTGILTSLSDTVIALKIAEGAHHVDLMFSNPLDPPALRMAREVQRDHIRKWVQVHSTT
ncbi:hypothetical protein H310_09132 [Aphanomyces invadans]|uniref:Lysosomal Pro-X carboxypeptidase n=1 Tax=Aphanomyces invadans TaxID=157072 RepID=A0A024TUD0_9STRA|nr:hypothetical protein H310_09132 [Aphanomyces invadans]ETV97780.1 hypothetical protein H310_09132 [Aphanomyces invadans]|eukprot:XP_008873341.1 hypothetical protein H310_09132 [Aphanomyces invadans]